MILLIGCIQFFVQPSAALAVDVPEPTSTDEFVNASLWHDFFCIAGEICETGDFNGDGKDDIVTFIRDTKSGSGRGDVYVALSTGAGFAPNPGTLWHDFFCIGNEICDVGDFNGDGKDDIVTFIRDTKSGSGRGDVVVALSTGTGFAPDPGTLWHDFFCIGNEFCSVGDFNGDGKDDIVTFIQDTKSGNGRGDVVVALSTGTGFAPDPGTLWHDFFCIGNEICDVGDFNGDGMEDIITFVRDTKTGDGRGDVYVALSTGAGFAPNAATLWHDYFCIGSEVCGIGDFNADGKHDIVTFVRDTKTGDGRGDVYVALSTGTGFAPNPGTIWHDYFCIGNEVCGVGDFNGDNRDDIITFIRDTKTGDGRGDVIVAVTKVYYLYVPYVAQ